MNNLNCEASRCVQRASHKFHSTLSGINVCQILTMLFLLLCTASSGMNPCFLAILSVICQFLDACEKFSSKPQTNCTSCRWIGGRRYATRKRKHTKGHSGQILLLSIQIVLTVSSLFLCFSEYVSQHFRRPITYDDQIELHDNLMFAHSLCLSPFASWYVSRLVRNRLMHSLCGNGVGKGNKGNKMPNKNQSKGKGKQEASLSQSSNPFANAEADHQHLQDMFSMTRKVEDQRNDRQYKARIRAALPQAAWMNHIPVLIQSEWSDRVCRPHELNAAGGVSYLHKDDVPDILERILYTQSPCAMVTTQSARELSVPYSSQEIRCSLEITAPDGTKEIVEANKFLTQLGYGRPVEMLTQGPCVAAPRTMHKMVARFDSPTGLQDGELTGRIVAEAVCKHIHSA